MIFQDFWRDKLLQSRLFSCVNDSTFLDTFPSISGLADISDQKKQPP